MLNASLVGANTVNGPGPLSVSTRPAAFTAATSVGEVGRRAGVLHDRLVRIHGRAADGGIRDGEGGCRREGEDGERRPECRAHVCLLLSSATSAAPCLPSARAHHLDAASRCFSRDHRGLRVVSSACVSSPPKSRRCDDAAPVSFGDRLHLCARRENARRHDSTVLALARCNPDGRRRRAASRDREAPNAARGGAHRIARCRPVHRGLRLFRDGGSDRASSRCRSRVRAVWRATSITRATSTGCSRRRCCSSRSA